MTHAKASHRRLQQARQKRQQQAKPRRLQQEWEPLQREQARAQRHLHALAQALEELGLPDTIVEVGQWNLQTQAKRLGQILGPLFPTVFGCRTTTELPRVRVWDKNLPGRMLGALPNWPRKHARSRGKTRMMAISCGGCWPDWCGSIPPASATKGG